MSAKCFLYFILFLGDNITLMYRGDGGGTHIGLMRGGIEEEGRNGGRTEKDGEDMKVR